MHGVEAVLNRFVLQVVNLEGQSHLHSLKLKTQTSDKELQGLLWWLSVLPWSNIPTTMAPFLDFRMVMCILCHSVLEVCDLLLDFIERYNKDIALSLKKTLDFSTVLRL